MRVRALRSFAGNGFAGYKGTELEVPDETGADLIRAGYAEKIEEETEEETTRAAILVAALARSLCLVSVVFVARPPFLSHSPEPRFLIHFSPFHTPLF